MLFCEAFGGCDGLLDGMVCRSHGDLIQLVYAEDGMDGVLIEKQMIDSFNLNNCEFEHNHY